MNDDQTPAIVLTKTDPSPHKKRRRKKRDSAQSQRKPKRHERQRPIEWGAIIVALLVILGWTVATGIVCGVIVLMCNFMGVNFNDDLFARLLLISIGLCFSVITIVLGTENLIKNINHHYRKHCLIFAALDFLLGFVFLIMDFDTESFLTDFLWLFLTFPVVLITLQYSLNK